MSNVARCAELYARAQAIVPDRAFRLPIAHSIFGGAALKEVRGFVIDPPGDHVVETVDLSDGPARR
jgi:hypothetical protein